MAEDGTVAVGITVDVGNLSTELEKAAEAFGAALNAAVNNAMRDVPGGAGGTRASGGESKVNADVAVDASDVTKSIQGALGGHKFRLNIDEAYLIGQIQTALNHAFRLNVATTGAGPTAGSVSIRTDVQDAASSISELISDVPKELTQALARKNKEGRRPLEDAIGDLYGELSASFTEIGRTLDQATKPMGKAIALFNAIGDDMLDIAKTFNENGPGAAANLVGQRLGVTGPNATTLATFINQAVRESSRSNFFGLNTANGGGLRELLATRQSQRPQPVRVIEEEKPVHTARREEARAAANEKPRAAEQEIAALRGQLPAAKVRVGSAIAPEALFAQMAGPARAPEPSYRAMLGARIAADTGVSDVSRDPQRGPGRGARPVGGPAGSPSFLWDMRRQKFVDAIAAVSAGEQNVIDPDTGKPITALTQEFALRSLRSRMGNLGPRPEPASVGGRSIGRGAMVFRPSANVGTGRDLEAERRANEQLGLSDKIRGGINWGALRGTVTGIGEIDLQDIGVWAGRGGYRNIVRKEKTGEFVPLEAETEEEKRLLKGIMGRSARQTVPGIEGQVRRQRPMQVIETMLRGALGEQGVGFLGTSEAPTAARVELEKLINYGGRPKQVPMRPRASGEAFAHAGAGTPGSLFAGLAEEANTERGTARLASVEQRLAALQGGDLSSRDSNRLRRLTRMREALIFRGAGRVSPGVRHIAEVDSNLGSQERIAGGIGKTPRELLDDLIEQTFPGRLAGSIEGEEIPDVFKPLYDVLEQIKSGDLDLRVAGTGSGPGAEIGTVRRRQGYASAELKNLVRSLSSEIRPALPREDRPKLRGLMAAYAKDIVGSIEPGPAGHPLVGGGVERGPSFQGQDTKRADQLTGGGMPRIRPQPTTFKQELEALLTERRGGPAEARALFSPENFAPEKAERISYLENLIGRSKVQKVPTLLELETRVPKGGVFDPEEAQRTIASIEERNAALQGITPQTPLDELTAKFGDADLAQQVLEATKNRAAALRQAGARKIPRGATGDTLRRAAAKTAIISGEIPEPEDVPRFAAINEVLGGAGGGRRGRVPGAPGGTPPDEPPGGEVTGAIHVIVDGQPIAVTFEGGMPAGAGGGLPGTYAVEADRATTMFRRGRTMLRKQTSASAQEAFGKDVERLRAFGLDDTEIQRLASKPEVGLGVAAAAFFGTTGGTGGGGGGFGGGGVGGLSTKALNRIRRDIGLGPAGFSEETFNLINEEDKFRSAQAGELRKLERQIPKRAFGPSLTDLLTNIGGVLDETVGAIDRLRREGGQLASNRARLAQLQSTSTPLVETRDVLTSRITGLQGQRAAAIAGGAAERSSAVRKFDTEIAKLEKTLGKVNVAYQVHNDLIEEASAQVEGQTKVFEAARAEVPGPGKRLAAFGIGALASGASIGVGIIISQLANAVLDVAGKAIGPGIDRALGNIFTTSRVNTALAEATRGVGGRANIAVAQAAVSTGLAAGTFRDISPALIERAQIEAGNKALQEQLDLLHTYQNTFGRSKEGLTRPTGGFGNFGILGTTPTAEMLQMELGRIPTFAPGAGLSFEDENTRRARAAIEGGQETFELVLTPAEKLAQGLDSALPSIASARDYIKAFGDTVDISTSTLDFWNEAIEKGGIANRKFVRDSSDAFDSVVEKTAEMAEQLRLPDLAAVLRQKEIGIPGLKSPQELQDILFAASTGAPRPSPQAVLAVTADERRAREGLRIQTLGFQLNQGIPAQFGMRQLARPLPTGQQIAGLGAAQGQDLSEVGDLYDKIGRQADRAVDSVQAFVRKQLPGGFADQFDRSISLIGELGQRITDIQIGVETKQAALAADQYSASLIVAERSLADAKALAGGITDAHAGALGILERQSYVLQRQSQSLSLMQSQRQISFQTALAGFMVPGTTPAEQAARVENAKLEADYAQEQLDIQKQLFGISGETFTVQAGRQVADLARQVDLLTRGRELTLETVSAEKLIAGLTIQIDKEAARADTIYQTAVERQMDIYNTNAQLVAATGKQLHEVAQDTVTAFAYTYRELRDEIDRINSYTRTSGRQSNDILRDPGSDPQASGNLFDTNGPTDLTVGEAGTETVAILRNPQRFLLPSGGSTGGNVINITVSGNKFSTEEDEDRLVSKLTAEVTRQMGRDAGLYGLRRMQ